MTKSRSSVFLAIIIFAGLFIRLYPVTANLPYTFWHDENNYIETALRFGVGKFDMPTYSHGGLFQMILFLEYALYYIVLRCAGTVQSSSDFIIRYLKDPSMFFIVARATVALFGTGIVYISYLIGSKVFNRRVGVTSALFTAFTLLMVQVSSLALADIPSVFILMTAFLLLVYSLERSHWKTYYYTACFLIGLAAACKYHTVFGIVPMYITAFLINRSRASGTLNFIKMAFFATLIVCAGFFAGMPGLISNLKDFYNDSFVRLGGEYVLTSPHSNKWLYYITRHLKNGLGFPLEMAALAGVLYAFYKRSKLAILLVSFPVSYYLLLMHSTAFTHHLIPAIPFILILAAWVIDDIVVKIMKKPSAAVVFIAGAVLVMPTASDSIKFVNILKSADTRIRAKAWIENNIDSGVSILEEGYVGNTQSHCPPLIGDIETLKRDQKDIIESGGSGFLIKKEISDYPAIYGSVKSYNIYKSQRLTERELDLYSASYIIMTSFNDTIIGEEFRYLTPVVLGSDYFEKRKALKDRICKEYSLMQSFCPTHEFTTVFPILMNHDYLLLRNISFNKLKGFVNGPRINIYER